MLIWCCDLLSLHRQRTEDASLANFVEIAECCERGEADGNKVENMYRPPDMLDSEGACGILELPLASIPIKPGAQEASVPTEFSHHATYRDLADTRDRCIGTLLRRCPLLGSPPPCFWFRIQGQVVVDIAAFMVMACKDDSMATQTAVGCLRMAAHAVDAFQYSFASVIAQMVLLFQSCTAVFVVEVEERPVDADAGLLVKR